jgi:hypothetical protein
VKLYSRLSVAAARRALAVVLAATGVAGGLTILATPAVSAAAATPAGWTQQAPSMSPSARTGSASAYDAATGQFILFGGSAAVGGSQNDTWVWDAGSWTKLNPAHSPAPREYADLAYDANTQQLVLFGGEDASLSSLDDTWTWDGTDWTQATPATSPPARSYATMAYDAASTQLVLFGGEATSTSLSSLDDTWTWDGSTWTQATPAVSPPARNNAVMAYDASTGDVVLFGGSGAGHTVLGDTWIWDGITWAQASPVTSPSPRVVATMGYDDSTHQLVLFGGSNAAMSALADTWTWDGTTWARQSPSASPGPRLYATMAYDSALPGLVLFGGEKSLFTKVNDTWTWGASAVVTPVPAQTGLTVKRITAINPVETAISVSEQSFPRGGSAGAVVLVGEGSYADAVTATPLAAAHNAPVLLNPSAALDPAVAMEITRVLPARGTVYVVGGDVSLSPAVATGLTTDGFTVVRLGGADRYATALKVADSLGDPSNVFLATGLNFPDGLTGSVAAAHVHGVLLLTDGTSLPADIAAYLTAHPGSVTAVGGPAAKAAPNAVPIVGADRYATAAMVAVTYFKNPAAVGIAAGTGFGTSLAAAAQLAKAGGPLLLSSRVDLAISGVHYLASITGAALSINVYGNTNTVGDNVALQIDNAVVAESPELTGLVLLSTNSAHP